MHLPSGWSTRIRDAELVEPERCQRRVEGMLAQHLSRTPHWPSLKAALAPLIESIPTSKYLHEIAEHLTRVLLEQAGWRGEITRSSDLVVRQVRSSRLADLAERVGADVYLCGTGGAKYLSEAPFAEHGIQVEYFDRPKRIDPATWEATRRLSAARALAVGDVAAEHQ
ncbi:WbqC family protein [Luteipulveratus sp. YIM 133132]|uniref:WbqC family protein n=1 Tax=Luteipulveratus flavus TaxID=3031728 RepID=UPI0023B13223|nr:WbqC family protein [Luteipulveratus sp. YIM 133132]MDE9364444.1 WbqC family protein [Luteipulveratus sp. YIM 133132]